MKIVRARHSILSRIFLAPFRSVNTRRSLHQSCIQTDDTQSRRPVDVEDALRDPAWSVESLLPSGASMIDDQAISSSQLHHLLRLSALPPPKDAAEEARMLSTLSAQLHFVREIQGVDTTGIDPLQSLRDETEAGRQEATIGLAALRGALDREEVKGTYNKRIRRQQTKESGAKNEAEDWDVLGSAGRKVGRYFVVEGGKEG